MRLLGLERILNRLLLGDPLVSCPLNSIAFAVG
jgi:hypothetical protein